MYVTKSEKEKQISQNDIITEIQNHGVDTTDVNGGMCFTLTLHLLKKYLKNLATAKKADIYTIYQKVLDHCRNDGAVYGEKLVSEFKHYRDVRNAAPGEKERIVDECVAFVGELTPVQIKINNPQGAANEIAVCIAGGDCAILVNMEGPDNYGHTIAFIREEDTLYYLNVSEKVEKTELHKTNAAKAITLEAYITTVISGRNKPYGITNVIYSPLEKREGALDCCILI